MDCELCYYLNGVLENFSKSTENEKTRRVEIADAHNSLSLPWRLNSVCIAYKQVLEWCKHDTRFVRKPALDEEEECELCCDMKRLLEILSYDDEGGCNARIACREAMTWCRREYHK